MTNTQLNVNTDELVQLSNKLERIHKSALPVAVRQTIDGAAFEAKKQHVIKTFDKQFTVRKKRFIRSHTGVNRSPNTFDVNKMKSEMGVLKGKSTAGDNLRIQELGGTIQDRDYIPLKGARTGKNPNRTIAERHYLSRIQPSKHKRVYEDQNFIRAAFAAGKKGYVRYGEALVQIHKIEKPSRDKLFIIAYPIYSYEEGRSVSIHKSPFIKPAGERALKSMKEIFREKAEKRFQKYE